MAELSLSREQLDERIVEVAIGGISEAMKRNPPRRRRLVDEPTLKVQHTLEERKVMALERIADALENQAAASSFLDDALQPPNGDIELTLENLDFYRTSDGRFVVRTRHGDREPTSAEADMLNGTIARRARGR